MGEAGQSMVGNKLKIDKLISFFDRQMVGQKHRHSCGPCECPWLHLGGSEKSQN